MTKVCLINPNRTYFGKSSSISEVDIGLPLGLLYIAGYLEKRTYEEINSYYMFS